ncbi:MAG: DNA polymerase/3'-5' exonuclease PolX [Actinomycetota bacterium]
MPRTNDAVEGLLQEYADLLSISGGDAFRVRTYEKAARSVGGYHTDIAGLDEKGILAIPNVGKSIAEKIQEYFRTGAINALEELRAQIPAGVRQMIAISTLGPKKAMLLYRDLNISSVEELADAIHEGRLKGLKGFGEKTEANILRGIELIQQSGDRVLLGAATDLAEEIVAQLSAVKGCTKCTYAGSLRRMAETIGDIDILVASDTPDPVMEAFADLSYVERVIARGDTKTSIRTTKGLQVDLRVVPTGCWGAALQYFTGSKAHNIRTREIAVRKGLKLSEYGLFDAKSGELIVAETEEEVYDRLGLPWIAPTLREDRGEIEAALRDELPQLVELKDIRGDLHTHTNLTDGLSTLEQMIATARERRYAYYAVTDHAPNLWMQRMTDEKMLAQRKRVRELGKQGKMVLLHGSELNIDAVGDVDWGPEFLEGFEVLVASVHTEFNQSKEEMTRRIVRACENPFVNIIGHPTTRKIGQRPPIEFDLEEVFAAAARTGTALEINAYPDRLDLRDEHVMWAKRHGVKFAIDTDSHSTVHLPFMRYGVGTAQRGWLTKDDVINAWPLARLRRFLKKGRR